MRVALIDNLQDPFGLLVNEGYEASTERYMAAVGGNTGNLAFVLGAKKSLGHELKRIGWGWSTDPVRENFDVIVISCANQIGAHTDLGGWADSLRRFNLPVVLIGLGAQRPNYEDDIKIPQGTLDFLQLVTELRPNPSVLNIGVRGTFTQEILKENGFESEVLGCPSLFISPVMKLGEHIASRAREEDNKRYAVAAGNPYHAGNLPFEVEMIRFVNRTGSPYILQHPNSLISLFLGDITDDEKVEEIGSTLEIGDTKETRLWFERNSYAFHEASSWMNFLRHYDGVFGARYHGVALGIQAGIPGLVVNIDSRTRELADTTGIPTISADEAKKLPWQDFLGKLQWSTTQGEDFDRNRILFAGKMCDFLQGNQLDPSHHLRELSEQ